MKPLLLLIALATFTSNSIAQNSNTYIPFPDSIANWISLNGGRQSCFCCTGGTCLFNEIEQYNMLGDTVIGLHSYKKLYRSYVRDNFTSGGPLSCSPFCSDDTDSEGASQYFGAIRQDTTLRTVYITTVNTTQEELLYDFNLHLGDTIPTCYVPLLGGNIITKIDSVLLEGVYHKRFLFKAGIVFPEADSGYTALIEGIGCTNGFLNAIIPTFEYYNSLSCFSNNNVAIYNSYPTTNCIPLSVGIKPQSIKTNNIILAPNPANKEVILTTTEELQNAKLEVHNLHGNVVLSKTELYGLSVLINVEKLAKGMYYVNVIQPSSLFTTQKLIIE
jgi:hypothetical protein